MTKIFIPVGTLPIASGPGQVLTTAGSDASWVTSGPIPLAMDLIDELEGTWTKEQIATMLTSKHEHVRKYIQDLMRENTD